MNKVFTGASMSLDGYISGPGDTGFEHLFRWLGEGDVTVATADPQMTLRMSAASAEYYTRGIDETGCLVVGRKLFDQTKAWGGQHPMDRHVVVLTHIPPADWPADNPNFTFVTDGIDNAIATAKRIAGDKDVGVNGGEIARQCLNAGLLDEILVDLVPVLLGGGTPFLDQLKDAPVVLEGPIAVIEGQGVTHLRYRVRKSESSGR